MSPNLAFDLETLTLHYQYEPVDIPIFFTLLFLEAALSFDNAAILAAMVRKLPVEQRRKALLYGLGGAYLFRILAIIGVSLIIQNPWLKALGGLYLLYLMAKHLLDKTPHDMEEIPGVAKKRLFGLSPFWSIVVAVEIADIAFALDQVLAAVGLFADKSSGSDKRLLIILASMIAIVLLRISAYYVGKLIDWFPKLETLAYLAVGWVGLKLVLVEVMEYAGYEGFDIPKVVSIGVTMLLLVVPVVVKATMELVRRRRIPA
jgi:YkoY family integral membrane protein